MPQIEPSQLASLTSDIAAIKARQSILIEEVGELREVMRGDGIHSIPSRMTRLEMNVSTILDSELSEKLQAIEVGIESNKNIVALKQVWFDRAWRVISALLVILIVFVAGTTWSARSTTLQDSEDLKQIKSLLIQIKHSEVP
jgi:hypothetical protein